MKLLTAPGASWLFRKTLMLPTLVAITASYTTFGSLHWGGGPANWVVRGDEPSSAGHGVAPVMVAPAAAAGVLTVGPGVVEVVVWSPGSAVVVEVALTVGSVLLLVAAITVPATASSTRPHA